MKILWFTNTPCGAANKLSPDSSTYGGGWLVSLEQQLVKNDNIELHICFYYSQKIASFKFNKTTYYPIYQSKILNHFGWDNDNREIMKLNEVVEAVKPDLIHIHGTEQNFGLIQAHTNTPAVVSIQGILSSYLEKYYSGIPAHISLVKEDLKAKIRFVSAEFFFQKMKRSAIRERKIYSLSKNIIGRTDWDRRISSILSPKAKYFIGNEILRSSFYENQWNKEKLADTLQIATTISNGWYKGLETVIKTAKILKDNGFNNFKWLVIGQGETDYLAKTVKRWLKIKYENLNINLLGKKGEKELVETLLGTDIYCMVSHIENSSNSVCEAMLLGMPIIASFAGGTDSIIENRKEGLLVQDGDPYSLAGAIKEMSLDYVTAIKYAQSARIRALSRHDRQNIGDEMVKIYKEIIK
jgi:glycosyltransferase involved in cell wall biosynthesis